MLSAASKYKKYIFKMSFSVISFPVSSSSLLSSSRLVLPRLHLLRHAVSVQPQHCTFILLCIFVLLKCRIKFYIAMLKYKNFIYFKVNTLFLYFNFLEYYTRQLFLLLYIYFPPNKFFFIILTNYYSQGVSLFQPVLGCLGVYQNYLISLESSQPYHQDFILSVSYFWLLQKIFSICVFIIGKSDSVLK